ncbi:hypothetical protein KSP39_PZI001596 [Platanthera zijinensis]|uniref:Uncharacterized protein n=1 Tax=Platanthera zijinensis TaxID=2320716 RepID=A0AAP0GF28_9ASPA
MFADRTGGERAPMSRAADVPIMEKPNPSPFRCPHCAGPLSKNLETSNWTVGPLIRDSFGMVRFFFRSICTLISGVVPLSSHYVSCYYTDWQIGSGVGGIASAFYGFNHGTGLRSYSQTRQDPIATGTYLRFYVVLSRGGMLRQNVGARLKKESWRHW